MKTLDQALGDIGFEIKQAFQRDSRLLKEYEQWLKEKGGIK